MSILTDDSLEFAKRHISEYYDSDFFPKPIEFDALWHNWQEVKQELSSRNVQKYSVTPPRIMAACKPKGGYRVVHQLEPLDTIIYTALTYLVAPSIEVARPPINDRKVCSYRIAISGGGFFSQGSGYTTFMEQTEAHAAQYEHVLVADIADFYNQIYLHRLNNAIEFANVSLKPIADDIEWFITTINSKSSQGIPVGPAASIILAEATLLDVDQFLDNKGAAHIRYVDDFRIFSDSERALKRLLEELTVYLYSIHRLTLSGEKTKILKSRHFIENQLHNPYAEEKTAIFKTLEILNPYTEDIEEISVEFDDEEEERNERLSNAITKILGFDYLDLGLARSAIRKAKINRTDVLVNPIIERFSFFSPVINDVILYFRTLTDDDFILRMTPLFEQLVNSEAVDNNLVHFWLQWYLAQFPGFIVSRTLRDFIFHNDSISNQAIAAIASRNVAWVRTKKEDLYHLGSWDRRALLNAARVLPDDERKHWLKLTIGSSPILLDRWVAKWVLETS